MLKAAKEADHKGGAPIESWPPTLPIGVCGGIGQEGHEGLGARRAGMVHSSFDSGCGSVHCSCECGCGMVPCNCDSGCVDRHQRRQHLGCTVRWHFPARVMGQQREQGQCDGEAAPSQLLK